VRKPPSRWSVVYTDSTCWGVSSIASAVFLFALAVKLTGTMPGGRGKPDRPVDPQSASLILAWAAAAALFLAAIVVVRVARIRSLFAGGHEVEASVRKVTRMRGGTKLKLAFELNGVPYEVSSTFVPWWRPPEFSEGTRIPLLVDPLNPKRAVPPAVYAVTAASGNPAGAER